VNENENPVTRVANATNFADQVAQGLSNITDVGAERIFRDPVHVGDRVVITAAALDIAGGMGVGNGIDNEGSGGGGGGAGGRTEGRPVAAIDIGPDGVTIRPIIDFTRIGVTLLIGAFAVWRATRRR
jgi:uncharacterized spore protein YtfJ